MSRPRIAAFRDRIARLGATAATILADAGIEALPAGRRYVLIRCPAPEHEDQNPSCSVHLENGRAKCFACGWTAGDVVALHKTLGGFGTMGDALRDLEARQGGPTPTLRMASKGSRRRHRGRHPGTPVTVATWYYRDAAGVPVFEIARVQYRLPDGNWFRQGNQPKPAKNYFPRHPGGSPRGMPERFRRRGSRPLYRLPELLAVPLNERIFVVEGEPPADALVNAGLVATTSSGGSSSAQNTDWSPLVDRPVVIWPDNDPSGMEYADAVVRCLRNLNPYARIEIVDVALLKLPPKADAVEWLQVQERKQLV